MTRLDERLRAIGIDDPGARYRAEPSLEQLEEERERLNERIREAKERAERDRAALSEEARARRERREAKHREQQKRAQRIVAFFADLGLPGVALGPLPCWSPRCRERRRAGVTVPPPLRVNLETAEFYCQDCGARGGPAEAARAFGEDPAPLLRKHGWVEAAEAIERRRQALETINAKLEAIGRDDTRFGDLRTMRDNAGSLDELEAVAEQAAKMRRKRSEST